jgi:hypothetical protein
MDIREGIAKQVEKLPLEMQEQVLRYATSLTASPPRRENGARLRQFSRSLDAVSARQMTEAIEEGCERVDIPKW